jgi:hypothetical protein
MPPSPNAKPKNRPATVPTRKRHELLAVDDDRRKADARMSPIGTLRNASPEQIRVRQRERERQTPRIENQMTNLRPNRSPSAPPATVPTATDAR